MQTSGKSPTLSRRRLLHAVALGGAATLVAACGTPAPSAQAPSSAGSAAAPASGATSAAQGATTGATAKPRAGGSLKIGVPGDVPTLDGHNSSGFNTLWNVFDFLGIEDDKLNLQPMLAESFELSSDSKHLKANLRHGVQFHTGRELTSEDIRWNFDRVRDPKAYPDGILSNYVKPISSMETPDKYTIIFNIDNSWPGLYDTIERVNILDPVTMQGPDAKTKPVGTGPFMFFDWAQGDHLTLQKNPNYWQTGKPLLDELRFQVFRDTQAMVTQLQAGAIDVADTPTNRQTAPLQQNANFQVLFNNLAGDTMEILCNCTIAPTNNKLVRQALAYALDRQRIVDNVFLKIGQPKSIPWYPTSPGYDVTKDAAFKFDVDKSKSLLQSAGVSGLTLEFAYSTASDDQASIAQIYQGDLAKIGVTLNLKPLDPVSLSNAIYTKQYVMSTSTSLYGSLHPGQMAFNPFYSPFTSFTGFKDEHYTELMNAVVTEVDPAKQKEVYGAWLDLVLDQAFTIPVASLLPRAVSNKKVQGLFYNMAECLKFTEASLA